MNVTGNYCPPSRHAFRIESNYGLSFEMKHNSRNNESTSSSDLKFEPVNKQSWLASLWAILTVFVFITYIHFDELSSLTDWWWSTTKYGHSILIFPVIVFLVYEKRHDLECLSPRVEPWLLVVLIPVAIGLSLFKIVSIQVVSETLTISLYALVIWLILGTRVTSIIAIPLLLLFMVVPIWEVVAPILTDMTATAAYYCLNFLNVPVLKEGGYLTIPEGVFEIAEACGGFRYFIVGLSLGLIYSYINFQTLKERVVVTSIAVLLSIVTNWIRVMIVIWAGHVTNMQHHFVHAHVKLGWWVFTVAFILFFILVNRFPLKKIQADKNKNEPISRGKVVTKRYALYATTISALFIISVSPKALNASFGTYTSKNLSLDKADSFVRLENWEGPFNYSGNWKPRFIGATNEINYTFRNKSSEIYLYIAYYFNQVQGKELINLNNTLLNPNWRGYKSKKIKVNTGAEKEIKVNEIRFNSLEGNKVIWSWYHIANSDTEDERLAKLLELKKIYSSNKISAVIAIMPEKNNDYLQSKALMTEFVKELQPKLHAIFTGSQYEIIGKE